MHMTLKNATMWFSADRFFCSSSWRLLQNWVNLQNNTERQKREDMHDLCIKKWQLSILLAVA